MSPNVSKLAETLGVNFKNLELLSQALTHRSYLNENKGIRQSNERLEFLGDSVLSILTSVELFRKFPAYPEGQLTNLRSALVRAKTLSVLAKKLHLGEYLLMSRGEEKSGGRENESLLADTFEAVLGAVFLDSGLKTANAILSQYLFPKISELERQESIFDYKSKLQELTQQQTKVSPTYKVIGESGPDHDKIFKVAVMLGTKSLSEGTGKSKQEAEQSAAKLALQALG